MRSWRRWTAAELARQGQTRKYNIVLHLPGPKEEAGTVQSTEPFWNLLFNLQVIDIVVNT